MSLKCYYIDAKKLSLDERTVLFAKIDGMAFITSIDMKNIGCLLVHWDLDTDIRKVIKFPHDCIVTDC